METYEVRYVVHRANSSEVLTEGTQPITVTNGGRMAAEKQVKAMFEHGGNTVMIQYARFLGTR